ncbi:MAG: DUF4321 domain-containing protein [Bacillota bacterium]
MLSHNGKSNWVLLLLMLAGVVIGGFLGELLGKLPYFSWLGYGQTFGFIEPLVLDLGVLALQFGLTIRFSIGGIIGILIAFILYRKF